MSGAALGNYRKTFPGSHLYTVVQLANVWEIGKEGSNGLRQGERKYSDTGLMLVEDPKQTLNTLCKLSNTDVDRRSFKSQYEREIGREISRTTLDTHLYTLVLFGFLAEANGYRSKYRLTPIARDLCNLLNNNTKREEYRNLLANILLYSDVKGNIFERFVKFVGSQEMLTREQVYSQYRQEVARTLIAWCGEAGIIGEYKERIWRIPQARRKYSPEEFLDAFKNAYSQLRKTQLMGLWRVYIPIGEVRSYVSPKLGLRKDEFYEHFRQLLLSDQGSDLKLHGGPSDAYAQEESFPFEGKSYIYVSMKES